MYEYISDLYSRDNLTTAKATPGFLLHEVAASLFKGTRRGQSTFYIELETYRNLVIYVFNQILIQLCVFYCKRIPGLSDTVIIIKNKYYYVHYYLANA